MKKVFIIHGFEGSPNGGWRPWLMAETVLASGPSEQNGNRKIDSEFLAHES